MTRRDQLTPELLAQRAAAKRGVNAPALTCSHCKRTPRRGWRRTVGGVCRHCFDGTYQEVTTT